MSGPWPNLQGAVEEADVAGGNLGGGVVSQCQQSHPAERVASCLSARDEVAAGS